MFSSGHCCEDTWCSLAPADQVQAGCVHDARLATARQVELVSHAEEHEGRVDAVLVELEHGAQLGESAPRCKGEGVGGGC